MSDDSGDKTEEATPKKLEDSRKKGQVWKSKDLTGALGMVVGLGVVKATWGQFEEIIQELFRFCFEHLAHPETLDLATRQLATMAIVRALVVMAPVVMAVAIISVLGDFLQVGPLFTMDPLMPKLDKLNPIQGLKGLINKKKIVELIKNLIKLSVTGYVVYGVVRDSVDAIAITVGSDLPTLMSLMGDLITKVCIRVIMLMFVFSIFDVWWQRHSYMKDLMMTKDEIKKEYKQSEGDPHHKFKRREMHMELLQEAEQHAVRKSDVVVTNPDHVAVALWYDRDKDVAPRVVAKGVDFKAERIKEAAREADVPMLRNVPLAHALYRVELDEEIPEELYDAVAEVLNFVYGLKNPGDQAQG